MEDPPPVGLLTVADVATLAELAQRSPFLGQLLPIADGPPDGAIWAYFLGKAEQEEIEEGEGVEVSIKIKKRALQSTSPQGARPQTTIERLMKEGLTEEQAVRAISDVLL